MVHFEALNRMDRMLKMNGKKRKIYKYTRVPQEIIMSVGYLEHKLKTLS